MTNLDVKPSVIIIAERDGKPHAFTNTGIYLLKKRAKNSRIEYYRDPITNEKHRIHIEPQESHHRKCLECHKTYTPENIHSFLRQNFACDPLWGYVNSEGDIVSHGLLPGGGDLIWTNKKLPYRDYCSLACLKQAKNKRLKERRERERLKKYQDLPVDERPDGHCKICGKDISAKRAGALTCCPAHTQRYHRRKDRRKVLS